MDVRCCEPAARRDRLALRLYRRGRLLDLGRGADAADLADRLLAEPEVLPIGLGARTRCGWRPGSASMATTSTPAPARSRRRWMGDPAGPAPRRGARRRLSARLILGRSRPGRAPAGGAAPRRPAPMREGTELFADAAAPSVGRITLAASGRASRLRGDGLRPIASAAPGRRCMPELLGEMLPVTVAKLPFIKPGYKRA